MRQQGKITFPEIGRQVKRLCTAVKCAQIQEEMGKEIQSDSRRNTIRRYWRNEWKRKRLEATLWCQQVPLGRFTLTSYSEENQTDTISSAKKRNRRVKNSRWRKLLSYTYIYIHVYVIRKYQKDIKFNFQDIWLLRRSCEKSGNGWRIELLSELTSSQCTLTKLQGVCSGYQKPRTPLPIWW